MEELSIEQKAKRFDEAIKRAKGVIEQNPLMEYLKKGIEYIFPELKESEDEKHRKWILEYLYDGLRESDEQFKGQFKCAIAWLEKQGEKETDEWKEGNIIRHGDILALVIKGRKAMKSNCEQITIQYPDEWVKAVPNEIEHFLNELEKQDKQKLTDKVRLKFKDGDWVTSDGESVFHIKIDNNKYQLETLGGTSCHFSYEIIEKKFRLWTIQDAKDGDVLNSMRVQATIIFKGFADDGKHILAYCALQKGIFIKQEMLWDRDFKPCPKNWNNELFSKIHEAGYEWDANKRELRKIEQNKQTFWEKCNHCEYFDGYDICLHKKNFGSVTNESKENCKNNKFYSEKQGEQKQNPCMGYSS